MRIQRLAASPVDDTGSMQMTTDSVRSERFPGIKAPRHGTASGTITARGALQDLRLWLAALAPGNGEAFDHGRSPPRA